MSNGKITVQGGLRSVDVEIIGGTDVTVQDLKQSAAVRGLCDGPFDLRLSGVVLPEGTLVPIGSVLVLEPKSNTKGI